MLHWLGCLQWLIEFNDCSGGVHRTESYHQSMDGSGAPTLDDTRSPISLSIFPAPTHPLYGLSIELLWMEWFPNRVNGLSGPEHLPTYATFKGRGKNFIWLTVQSLILVPKISIIHFYWQTQWNHGLLQILQCFQLFLKVSKFCSLLRINNFLHFNCEFS